MHNAKQDSTNKTTGMVHLKLVTHDGSVKTEFDHKNLVVQTGLNLIATRMSGSSSGAVSHMAIGTSDVAVASGDVSLGAELNRATTTVAGITNNVVTWTSMYGAGVATGNVSELGLFNASSAGNMIARTVFPVVQKGASDVLYVSWSVTFN